MHNVDRVAAHLDSPETAAARVRPHVGLDKPIPPRRPPYRPATLSLADALTALGCPHLAKEK